MTSLSHKQAACDQDAIQALHEAEWRNSIGKRGWQADCPKCVASKFTCDEHFIPEAEWNAGLDRIQAQLTVCNDIMAQQERLAREFAHDWGELMKPFFSGDAK